MSAIGDGKADVQSIAAFSDLTIQPPSGEEWVIRDVSGSGAFPSVIVGTASGGSFRMLNTLAWQRKMSLFITNAIPLVAHNGNGVAQNIGYSGVVTSASSPAGRADSKSATATVLGSFGTLTIQPPSGQSWMLLDVSSGSWITVGSDQAPLVTLQVSTGFSIVVFSNNAGGSGVIDPAYSRPWAPILTNTVTALIVNNIPGASSQPIGYSAVRIS